MTNKRQRVLSRTAHLESAVAAFRSFEAALQWGMTNGRDNCLPCHEWRVEQTEQNKFQIAIRYAASGEFVGYAS